MSKRNRYKTSEITRLLGEINKNCKEYSEIVVNKLASKDLVYLKDKKKHPDMKILSIGVEPKIFRSLTREIVFFVKTYTGVHLWSGFCDETKVISKK